jgi:transposase
VKKISTVAKRGNEIFKEPKLTIGLDLGDRTSHYCVLDEAGKVILEHRLPTTLQGIQQVFRRIPRSRIALETGTHSPWVIPTCLSRLLMPRNHVGGPAL